MSLEINDAEYVNDRKRISNNILEDVKIKQQNGRLWTPFHDMQMYEYVIKYNFNFFDIANRFQALCNNKKKYEYSEDAVRLHWAFLHAMRMNNRVPNEKYYQQMKLKYDKNEETTFKTVTQEKKDNMMISEEEDIKRMKEEFEKMQREKNMSEEEKMKKKEEEEKKKKEEEQKKKEEEQKKKKKLQEEEQKKKKKLEEEKKRLEEENKPLKSSLYKEEPQFIKDLFSKEVPKEIKEKLEQDKGKYTKKQIDYSKISHDYTLIPIKPLIETKTEDDELFPIKSNKQKNASLESLKEHEKTSSKSLESQLKNTKNMNDYIQEDPVLKKQYEQLNNFCKFASESINYIVNKETGLDDHTSSSEKKKTFEEANKKLNELFLGPIYQKTKEEGFSIEDFNKKIDEEEHKMYFESTNYDNYMKTAPVDKDQEMKRKKFQEHLFAKANQMSTQELLDRISDIIKQPVSTSSSSTNLSNNRIESALNDVNSTEPESSDLNRQILNTVVRNINNQENSNEEDQKSEKTKAQSETVNNDLNSSINQSEVSNIDKRYRHVYKGMIYYTDKPDESKNKNKKSNKKNSDDELEYEDDSDEEDYNN